MYEGINHILNRIHTIEQKFSVQRRQEGDFEQIFRHEAGETVLQAKQQGSAQNVVSNTGIAGMIEKSARKYGVDPKLVNAVAKTESNYVPNAVSEAGAVGVMQLMPATAASLGVNDIYDPQENIEGGTKYIKQLLNTFDGDVSKAVAAYNAGPQAVKNYNGIPPYSETKNYVKKVLDLYS